MISATFPAAADKLEACERVIVCDAFLDWLAIHRSKLMERVRTVPNPDRVGILDRWIAYTGTTPVA